MYNRSRTSAADSTATIPEEVPGLKTNYDETFTVDGKYSPLKEFLPEEIYLGRLPKSFCDLCQEKKTDRSTKSDDTSKNRICREKGRDRKNPEVRVDQYLSQIRVNYDTRSVIIDFTFTVAAALTTAQAYLASYAIGKAIPEYPTIKGILSAAGAWMQVSVMAAPRSMD